ncbi:MAG TPA: hypothetical protein VK638_32245 [Edaphobacter sp.]|nr:hypothetical protein [Edaphobacter sp.]
MPTFLFNLPCEPQNEKLIASCPIVGEIEGFRGVVRTFKSEGDVVSALNAAGIADERYQTTLSQARSAWGSFFEISQCETQKLDILQTDSPE